MDLLTKAINKMRYYKEANERTPDYVPVKYAIGRVYAFESGGTIIFTKNPRLNIDGEFICEFFNGEVTSLKYYHKNAWVRTDPNNQAKCTHVVLR